MTDAVIVFGEISAVAAGAPVSTISYLPASAPESAGVLYTLTFLSVPTFLSANLIVVPVLFHVTPSPGIIPVIARLSAINAASVFPSYSLSLAVKLPVRVSGHLPMATPEALA